MDLELQTRDSDLLILEWLGEYEGDLFTQKNIADMVEEVREDVHNGHSTQPHYHDRQCVLHGLLHSGN